MNATVPRVVLSVVGLNRAFGHVETLCRAGRALRPLMIAPWLWILGAGLHVKADVQMICQDRGHFETECSVAEVVNDRGRILVDDVVFSLGSAGGTEDDRIKVTGYVDPETGRPGLRFEAFEGVLDVDACGSQQLYTVFGFISNRSRERPIDVSDVTVTVDYEGVHEGAGETFRGAFLDGFVADAPFPTRDSRGIDFFTPETARGNPVTPPPVDEFFRPPGAELLPVTLKFDPSTPGNRNFRVDFFHRSTEGFASPFCGRTARLRTWTITFGIGNAPPLSENRSGMVRNNDFSQCAGEAPDGWQVSGPGSATCTESFGNAVELATEEGEQAVTQQIDTPNSSFVIEFDYRFLEDDGSLEVRLDGQTVATIPARAMSSYSHESVLINEPALMDRTDVELRFALVSGTANGRGRGGGVGSPSGLLLTNIVSPNFELISARAEALASASVSERREQIHELCDILSCIDGTEPVILFGSGLSLGGTTSIVDSPLGQSRSTAQVSSRAAALFSGVQVGCLVQVDVDGGLAEYVRGSAVQEARVVLGIGSAAVPAGTRVPIDYKLRIHGIVTVLPRIPIDRSFEQSLSILYGMRGSVAIRRARLGLGRSAMNELEGEVGFTVEAEDPRARFDFDDSSPAFVSGSTCDPPGENDPEPGAPTARIIEMERNDEGALTALTFELDAAFCYKNVLYAGVGDHVEVSIFSSLLVQSIPSEPLFDGAIIGDFTETARGTISTSTPGVEFVATPLVEAALDGATSPAFRRGDADADGAVDVADVVVSVGDLFPGFALIPPSGDGALCSDATDINDDGVYGLSDVVHLASFLFSGGAPPPAPFAECGPDPTPDELSCQSFAGCE